MNQSTRNNFRRDNNNDRNNTPPVRVVKWSDLKLHKRGADGWEYVNAPAEKAQVLREYRKVRALEEGYSFFRFSIITSSFEDCVNDRGIPHENVIHALSMDLYTREPDRYSKVLDPVEKARVMRKWLDVGEMPEDYSFFAFDIDWDGIDDAVNAAAPLKASMAARQRSASLLNNNG